MSERKQKAERLWCLRGPNGHLYHETVSDSRSDVWMSASGRGGFGIVAHDLGDEWWMRFWKRERESKASARRHGWTIVRVTLREAKR